MVCMFNSNSVVSLLFSIYIITKRNHLFGSTGCQSKMVTGSKFWLRFDN